MPKVSLPLLYTSLRVQLISDVAFHWLEHATYRSLVRSKLFAWFEHESNKSPPIRKQIKRSQFFRKSSLKISHVLCPVIVDIQCLCTIHDSCSLSVAYLALKTRLWRAHDSITVQPLLDIAFHCTHPSKEM